MKIADIKTYYVSTKMCNWVFLEVETDEGLKGVGEATNFPGSDLIAGGLAAIRHLLIGENPFDIDRLWQKMFRHYTYLGSRGAICSLIGGVDIALWDLKGKALGRPVYDLLGGSFRNPVPLYTHIDGKTPEACAAHAKSLVAEGYSCMKLDPFPVEWFGTRYVDGHLPPEGIQQGAEIVAAIREAVGNKIEILIDAHGAYNVPTALQVAKALRPYDIGWLEEPVPPESFRALQQIREAGIGIPLCVGERHFTRWDFLPIFENRLADYIMPDVIRTGGISELRKISTMAEVYNIPVAPHDANGAINIIAGAHVMASIPNCYKVEFSSGGIPEYNAFITPHMDIRDGGIYLPERPGLGVELNHEAIREHPAVTEHGRGHII